MDKYKNNKTNKIAVIISDRAAGMCEKTIGLTLVVYKYEGDNYEYPFVMEDREFYRKHTKMD
jgi:hypothetical protein